MKPASQLHWPVTASQLPSPFLQSQVCEQSAPQCPASQAATQSDKWAQFFCIWFFHIYVSFSLAQQRLLPCFSMIPFLHLCPVQPGAQVHRPLTGSQRALFSQMHFIWHFWPKRPLGHTAWKKEKKTRLIYHSHLHQTTWEKHQVPMTFLHCHSAVSEHWRASG